MAQETGQRAHLFGSAAVLSFILTGCVSADFGDAPDGGPTNYPPPFTQTGNFPTLDASGGARTENVDEARLGPSASAEDDANDANDPDGQPNLNPANTDSDDGLVDFVVVLTSIPPPAQMVVRVSGPPGSSGGQYFINVLIDMNMNGEWDGVIGPNLNEWAVQNFPVTVSAGVNQDVRLPGFLYGNGNRLPDGAWMRISLTREQITGPWNGTGTFSAGEIEDHVIRLPELAPGKVCMPVMTCPPIVGLPGGGAPVRFQCNIANAAADDCTATYTLNSETNAGSVAVISPPGTWVVGEACAPNGLDPVVCTGPIDNAGRPVTYQANKVSDPLPSRWRYTITAKDPPAIIEDWGVIVGFGDSTGTTEFVDGEVEEQRQEEGPK